MQGIEDTPSEDKKLAQTFPLEEKQLTKHSS